MPEESLGRGMQPVRRVKQCCSGVEILKSFRKLNARNRPQRGEIASITQEYVKINDQSGGVRETSDVSEIILTFWRKQHLLSVASSFALKHFSCSIAHKQLRRSNVGGILTNGQRFVIARPRERGSTDSTKVRPRNKTVRQQECKGQRPQKPRPTNRCTRLQRSTVSAALA